MSPEIRPHLFIETGRVIERPVAPFVRSHKSRVHIDPNHTRAYIGLQFMQREANPFLQRRQGADITGLEPYFIGKTKDPVEVVEEIAKYGYRTIKSLEALDDPYVLPRVKRLISTGRISTDIEERARDLRILMQVDLSIGNVIRKLQTGMTQDGEKFRTETHKIIGNPIERFTYSIESHSESLVLPQIIDTRKQTEIQRQALDEILIRLPIHLQRGYNFFSSLLKPTLSSPVERSFLQGLRTAAI